MQAELDQQRLRRLNTCDEFDVWVKMKVVQQLSGQKLRFATIEANAGWIPWLLTRMDEVYRKQHMWVRPKLSRLPSEYWRSNGASSVCDDHSSLLLAEHFGLVDNLMFANDYPHHEGTWPHSAEAIERTMPNLTDRQRSKILGLNAARLFGLEVPKHQQLAVS